MYDLTFEVFENLKACTGVNLAIPGHLELSTEGAKSRVAQQVTGLSSSKTCEMS